MQISEHHVQSTKFHCGSNAEEVEWAKLRTDQVNLHNHIKAEITASQASLDAVEGFNPLCTRHVGLLIICLLAVKIAPAASSSKEFVFKSMTVTCRTIIYHTLRKLASFRYRKPYILNFLVVPSFKPYHETSNNQSYANSCGMKTSKWQGKFGISLYCSSVTDLTGRTLSNSKSKVRNFRTNEEGGGGRCLHERLATYSVTLDKPPTSTLRSSTIGRVLGSSSIWVGFSVIHLRFVVHVTVIITWLAISLLSVIRSWSWRIWSLCIRVVRSCSNSLQRLRRVLFVNFVIAGIIRTLILGNRVRVCWNRTGR